MKKQKNDAGSRYQRTTEPNLLWSSDDLLFIGHGAKRRVHRIYFNNLPIRTKIPTETALFKKLINRTEPDKKGTLNWYRSQNITIGLSKYGFCELFAVIDKELLPREFIRTMRYNFCLTDLEIRQFSHFLHLKEVEISHSISDPFMKLKDAKIELLFETLKKKAWSFVDESDGVLELELKGDPELVSNLEFLMRDKLKALTYFNSLTELLRELAEIQGRNNVRLISIENWLESILVELWNFNNTTELLRKDITKMLHRFNLETEPTTEQGNRTTEPKT